ncbi:hypothetical protein L1887_49202 [Cichorium endivia]|nr:hypothetical protein L1887_49202 [Cichorium endivia]
MSCVAERTVGVVSFVSLVSGVTRVFALPLRGAAVVARGWSDFLRPVARGASWLASTSCAARSSCSVALTRAFCARPLGHCSCVPAIGLRGGLARLALDVDELVRKIAQPEHVGGGAVRVPLPERGKAHLAVHVELRIARALEMRLVVKGIEEDFGFARAGLASSSGGAREGEIDNGRFHSRGVGIQQPFGRAGGGWAIAG